MNKEKLIKIIGEWLEQDDIDLTELRYCKDEPLIINNIQIETEENFGGSGKGDEYWTVIKVTEGDCVSYWMIPGWYQSHHGGELELDDIYQVEPYQKVIRDWRML